VEIIKPGGFLIAIMGKTVEKDDRGMIKLEDLEDKIKKLEDMGVITYEFQRGFNGELASEEIFDDLRVFEDVGWVETDFSNPHCKLTDRGIQIFNELEIPEGIQEKFNKIFQ